MGEQHPCPAFPLHWGAVGSGVGPSSLCPDFQQTEHSGAWLSDPFAHGSLNLPSPWAFSSGSQPAALGAASPHPFAAGSSWWLGFCPLTFPLFAPSVGLIFVGQHCSGRGN